ncbi:MAG TPA: protein-glutamate O-methyltransferase [Planctomycetota bacterium]|nr:protein-glutamate O-methyltransferase [Planctomycetota bacterium]
MNSPHLAMAGPSGNMSRATFSRFRGLIYRLSGIALGEGKEGLVRARVSKRMRLLGLQDYEAYLDLLLADPSGEEIVHLLDVISTNVTSFFREESHFQVLSEIASRWRAEKRTRLRLWSAACSTGEEPYSMAMTLLEASEARPLDLKILATDLSTRALAWARAGTYSADKTAFVHRDFRTKYFDPDGRRASMLRVGSELRKTVTFARLNLAATPFPMSGPFDAVFCRNVMIYFDAEVRRRLLAQIHTLLRPGGYLFVGHSESLSGLTAGFKTMQASVYVKT